MGHDPSVLASLEAGLDGAIAASASVLPGPLLGIAEAHQAGDSATAQKHLARLNAWCTASQSCTASGNNELSIMYVWHSYCSHDLEICHCPGRHAGKMQAESPFTFTAASQRQERDGQFLRSIKQCDVLKAALC